MVISSTPKSQTLTMPPAISDDDDFQDPTPSTFLNQTRPRKKPKPSAGKENRLTKTPKTPHFTPSVPIEKNRFLKCSSEGKSSSFDDPSAEAAKKVISLDFGRCEESKSVTRRSYKMCVVSRLDCVARRENEVVVPLKQKKLKGGNDVVDEQCGGEPEKASSLTTEVCGVSTECREIRSDGGNSTFLASASPKSLEKLDCRAERSGGSIHCENCSSYAMSLESMLVGSGAMHSFSEEDGVGGFEAGSQLNELMDLCFAMDDAENKGDGENSGDDGGVSGEHLDDGEITCQIEEIVDCPLCGVDITDLSEELRHVHTNGCLDREGCMEVSIPTNNEIDITPKPATDVPPVVEFLRSLGLSRYEEIFIKEEIDWHALQVLTEEDLLKMGVVALGPRKRIVHALDEFRGKKLQTDLNSNTPKPMLEGGTKVSSGNKLITEYFQGSTVSRSRASNGTRPSTAVEKRSKTPINQRAARKNISTNSKLKDIPAWCCIPGTPFRVDAFRFLRADCSHWFLTHFHIDHYQGLTRNFQHGKIYCSSITANLVKMKIGIPLDRLHVLPLNQKISIAGIDVTCLDANHCPGSIIILFEPPNGKAVLHTGDFRFCEAMTKCAILQSCSVHTLILDTTYCNPQYDFPKQDAVIQFVIEAIQAEAFNPKTLFLIGSYTVGKERLFCEVARFLRKKVHVGAAKLRLLQCLDFPEEDMQWFTSKEMESNIHVVPLWTIASFKRMKHITSQFAGRYNLIVAISPTGWSFGKGKKKSTGTGRKWQQGTIIRYEVPYSEHSSFSELQEFVQFVSPEVIIPSVNNSNKYSADAMVALLTSHVQTENAL